jgi:hypothetical protein
LKNLNAQKLVDNLNGYKAFKRQERIDTIQYLKNQIDNLYADESNLINLLIFILEIKEERLIEYTDGLVKELKRTSLIGEFANRLRGFMPKYNELKHFNA